MPAAADPGVGREAPARTAGRLNHPTDTADKPGMSDPSPTAARELWCLGMRHAGTRPLSAAERERLADAGRLARLRLRWTGIAYGLLWGTAFPVMMVLRARESHTAILIMYVLFASIMLGLPIVGFALFPSLARWREAVRDLADGTVDCFRSPSARDDAKDETLVLASRSRRVLAGPAGAVGRVAEPRLVPTTEAADWWLRLERVEGATVERRRMHACEQDELRHAVGQAWLADRATLASLLQLAVFGIAWRYAPLGLDRPLPTLVALYYSLQALRQLWSKGMDLLHARRMALDLRDGLVLRLVPDDDGSRSTEFLPHSRMTWRVDGVPGTGRGWPATPPVRPARMVRAPAPFEHSP